MPDEVFSTSYRLLRNRIIHGTAYEDDEGVLRLLQQELDLENASAEDGDYVIAVQTSKDKWTPINTKGADLRGLLEGSVTALGTVTARVTLFDRGYTLQQQTGSVDGGTFNLEFNTITTTDLAWDSTATQVSDALKALADLNDNDVYVEGGPLPGSPIIITINKSSALGLNQSLTNGTYSLIKKTDEWTKSARTETVREVMGVCGSIPNGATILFGPVGTVPYAIKAANCSCNEIQRILIDGTGTAGTFTLTFGGQTTSALDYNATAQEVEDALEALSSIGTGNVRCTGGNLDVAPIDVEFIGTFAGLNQNAMTFSDSITGGTLVLTTIVNGGI